MFSIQIAQEDLANALSFVSSTVGNNSQNLGDDCISLKDLDGNKLEIYTTNGVEFSKVEVVLTSGTATAKPEQMPFVNYKRFKSMIDSIPAGEYVSIKSTVNDIEINYGTRKKPLKLTGSVNGMITLPTVNKINEITVDRDSFMYALKHACTIIKDDGNNALTNCIRLYADGFNMNVTAVDVKNNRMFTYNDTTTTSNSGEVLLEAGKMNKASKMFELFNDITFECGNNIIRTYGSDSTGKNPMIVSVEYYTHVLNGIYPNHINSLFNNVAEYSIVNKDELKNSLIRIDAIEDNTIGSGTMELSINGNLVNIAKTSQYGVVEDSFNAENEITSQIKETFKAKALAEVLKNFADNGTYGTPNTFLIGKSNNASAANGHYILKEGGQSKYAFLLTGVSTGTSNP